MFYVRPHVAAFLLLSFLMGITLQSIKLNWRSIILMLLAVVLFMASYQRVLNYVGIKIEPEETNYSSDMVGSFYEQSMKSMEKRSKDLSTGGSAVEVTSINLFKSPIYFVAFLCGPFIWQARKPMQFVGAIESMIYNIMLIYIIMNWRYFRRFMDFDYKYTWVVFIIISSVLLGMSYTNFGLTIRQKCMVIPPLVLVYMMVKSEKIKSRMEEEQAIGEIEEPEEEQVEEEAGGRRQ
jgi:hypothetical protein